MKKSLLLSMLFSIALAHLYTAPVSAQTLHPEHLLEKNLVVASYDLFEEEEKVLKEKGQVCLWLNWYCLKPTLIKI